MDHKRFFSWNFAKADLGSCQFGFNFTHCPAQSTSKIICLFFALFLALNLVFSALALFLFQSCSAFSPLLSCGRKFSQLQAKVSLHRRRQRGLAWPSLNAQLQREFLQQQANKGCCSPPQKLCCTHGNLEVKSLNTVITTGAGALKLAD